MSKTMIKIELTAKITMNKHFSNIYPESVRTLEDVAEYERNQIEEGNISLEDYMSLGEVLNYEVTAELEED